jgi:hypothetical protein
VPARNQKLTHLIAGRRVASSQQDGDGLIVAFEDASKLTIRTKVAIPTLPIGGTVHAVQEDGPLLLLGFEGGESASITVASPGGSVILRDGHYVLEYAG